MCCETHRIVRVGVVLVVGLAIAAVPAVTQEAPTVTALSDRGSVHWTPAGGERELLGAGIPVAGARLEVAAEQQVMLYSPAGEVVVIALGACRFDVRSEVDQVEFELLSGRLMFATPTPADEQVVQVLVTDEDGDRPLVSGFIGRGWTFLARQGTQVDLAFVAEDGEESLALTVAGTRRELPAGQRLALEGGVAREAELEPWLSQSGFDASMVGQRIGIASAKVERGPLQEDLVLNVVSWDVFSQAQNVIERMEIQQFRPEIRTVAVAVTGQVQSTVPAGRASEVKPTAYANEVPPLSPAAISVGGVTALERNENARDLLNITGSRGLGYRGLSRLALPGLTPAGTRTTGPAGLGAQR